MRITIEADDQIVHPRVSTSGSGVVTTVAAQDGGAARERTAISRLSVDTIQAMDAGEAPAPTKKKESEK